MGALAPLQFGHDSHCAEAPSLDELTGDSQLQRGRAKIQHRPASNTEFSYCFNTKHVVLCCPLLIIHRAKSVSQMQQSQT